MAKAARVRRELPPDPDHLGDHAQAVTCYQRALGLFQDLGNRYGEASTLTNLGDTYHTAGNPQAARDAWKHALEILDELAHPDAHQVRTKLKEHSHPQPPHQAPPSTWAHDADPA